jgi:hypothetical protein
VAAGPYQFVRNPIYIDGFLVLAGFGLYERSPAILFFALPWSLLAQLFVILYEEPHLHKTFRAPYDACCRSAPLAASPLVVLPLIRQADYLGGLPRCKRSVSVLTTT